MKTTLTLSLLFTALGLATASADDGKTWGRSFLVYPGPAGYSQLGMLSFARIGTQSALLAL